MKIVSDIKEEDGKYILTIKYKGKKFLYISKSLETRERVEECRDNSINLLKEMDKLGIDISKYGECTTVEGKKKYGLRINPKKSLPAFRYNIQDAPNIGILFLECNTDNTFDIVESVNKKETGRIKIKTETLKSFYKSSIQIIDILKPLPNHK